MSAPIDPTDHEALEVERQALEPKRLTDAEMERVGEMYEEADRLGDTSVQSLLTLCDEGVPALLGHISVLEADGAALHQRILDLEEQLADGGRETSHYAERAQQAEHEVEQERQRHSVTRDQLAKAHAQVEQVGRDLELSKLVRQKLGNDISVLGEDLAAKHQLWKREEEAHRLTLKKLDYTQKALDRAEKDLDTQKGVVSGTSQVAMHRLDDLEAMRLAHATTQQKLDQVLAELKRK